MKQTIKIIALLVFVSISILAQEKIDQKAVTEKYDQISRIENMTERREFFGKQTDEMKVALWHENINRKTNGIELSAEQKAIIEEIKTRFLTVEFMKSQQGKTESEAGEEFKETMAKANQLLGRQMLVDLFGILGDSKTLKKQ